MINRESFRRGILPRLSALQPFRLAWISGVALLSALALSLPQSAMAAGTGTIEGRVLNADTGLYLNNARVTVEGTNLEAYTDASGSYRLTGVPEGAAKVDVFYTGLNTQTLSVNVAGGQTVAQDVNLSSSAAATGEVVKLEKFTVTAQRETNQSNIAVNEQRFAPNLKTVVSSDQFGHIPEGNLGEFMKFLPSVSVDYTASDVRTISLRGIPSNYTEITMDGYRLAASNSGNTGAGRTIELEQVSINNSARNEVVKSRTPDIGAEALGGSINSVSHSAFEYAHPELKYNAYIQYNRDYQELGATPGPIFGKSHKMQPGFDLTYANPVSDKFGFTVALLDSNYANPQYRSNRQWFPNGTNTNIAALTSPLQTTMGNQNVSVSNPFLEKYTMQDGPKNTHRNAAAFTADWKISKNNTLTFRAQTNFYDNTFGNRNLNFDTGTTGLTPASFGPDFTNGAAGNGKVTFGSSWRWKFGNTWITNADFNHNGPVWKYDAGLDFAHSSAHYQDRQGGYFEANTFSLINNPSAASTDGKVTVAYSGLGRADGTPSTILVTDKTNTTTLNPYDVENYQLNTSELNPVDAIDQVKNARADASRKFDIFIPTTIKVGAAISDEVRDIRNFKQTWSFVGPDGKANTSDDSVAALFNQGYDIVDHVYSTKAPPWGLPNINWPSNAVVWQMYQDHPSWFSENTTTNRQNEVNGSSYFNETISAAYIRFDNKALNNRLNAVWGIRFERTDDAAQGGYQAGGNLVYRGVHAKKHYANGYPSISLSYNITHNLVARLAYTKAVGRPSLNNIIPNVSVDTTKTPAVITTNNAGLAAEQSDNFDAALEYYFKNNGVATVGAFRKDVSNFFGSTSRTATDTDLANLGLDPTDPALSGATITEVFNSGKARITGIEASYQQNLTFLPGFAKGFNVFANTTLLHLQGTPQADYSTFISKIINWGVGYDNKVFDAKLSWNYRGRERLGNLVFDNDGSGYAYFRPRLYMDVYFEYRFMKSLAVFFQGRNVTNVPQDTENYSDNTPAYARLVQREDFPPSFTIGIKGTF